MQNKGGEASPRPYHKNPKLSNIPECYKIVFIVCPSQVLQTHVKTKVRC